MATNFSDLKRNSTKDLQKLTAEVSKLSTKSGDKKSYEDTRFWKPQVDKAGNGFAVIRFLPIPKDEEMPWVQIFSHAFQGPGGLWYIENSLTTLNKKDPVSEFNSALWNTGLDSDKAIARAQKRKLSYIANIYVIKDPANPDNEGKTFLYKFGKKIYDKINDQFDPDFEDETPVNPFDLFEGANFKLKIRKVEGYQNYDKSEFDTPGPLSDDDQFLERIWKSEYPLQEFLEEKNFKTYEELKERLTKTLGLGTSSNDMPTPVVTKPAAVERPAAKVAAKTADESKPWKDDDDAESLSYFEKLAED